MKLIAEIHPDFARNYYFTGDSLRHREDTRLIVVPGEFTYVILRQIAENPYEENNISAIFFDFYAKQSQKTVEYGAQEFGGEAASLAKVSLDQSIKLGEKPRYFLPVRKNSSLQAPPLLIAFSG